MYWINEYSHVPFIVYFCTVIVNRVKTSMNIDYCLLALTRIGTAMLKSIFSFTNTYWAPPYAVIYTRSQKCHLPQKILIWESTKLDGAISALKDKSSLTEGLSQISNDK